MDVRYFPIDVPYFPMDVPYFPMDVPYFPRRFARPGPVRAGEAELRQTAVPQSLP